MITFDAAAWATDASGTASVALTDPPRTGDLVLRAMAGRFTHIGFLVSEEVFRNVRLGTTIWSRSPAGGSD